MLWCGASIDSIKTKDDDIDEKRGDKKRAYQILYRPGILNNEQEIKKQNIAINDSLIKELESLQFSDCKRYISKIFSLI